MVKKETRIVKDQWCNHPRFTVFHTKITPSWKRFGDGSAMISFVRCDRDDTKPASGWLEIKASETSFSDKPNGRDVTKDAWLTLDLETARELRDFLNEMDFGDK